jgi:alpha-D-ribose 1-methylphosphonate 5-triphosphate synthase subunit PhnH
MELAGKDQDRDLLDFTWQLESLEQGRKVLVPGVELLPVAFLPRGPTVGVKRWLDVDQVLPRGSDSLLARNSFLAASPTPS